MNRNSSLQLSNRLITIYLLNAGIDLLYSYWILAIFRLLPFCTLLPFVAPCNRNQRSKMWRKQRMSRLGGDSILSCKNRSRGKKWFILFWNRNSNKLLIIVTILISHFWNIRYIWDYASCSLQMEFLGTA